MEFKSTRSGATNHLHKKPSSSGQGVLNLPSPEKNSEDASALGKSNAANGWSGWQRTCGCASNQHDLQVPIEGYVH